MLQTQELVDFPIPGKCSTEYKIFYTYFANAQVSETEQL